jgi:hypothetical protein
VNAASLLRAVALSIALASIALAGDPATVLVVGPSGQSRSLDAADLERMSPREVTVADPHGKGPARYRGVSLIRVLASVGTPVGDALRGKTMALHVRAEATDGYVAAFSVAELDEGFGKADAILAFQRDGQPLGSDVGPFRLVVPTDKRGGR